MFGERILTLRKVELPIVKEGPILKNLNQEGVFRHLVPFYPVDPPVITALTIYAVQDPIPLTDIDITGFKQLVREETAYLSLDQQICGQLGNFSTDRAISDNDSSVSALEIAHLFGHVLLLYAKKCREPIVKVPDSFVYKEAGYRNRHNEKEFVVLYNFPTRMAHVSGFADTVLDFLELWARGKRIAKNGGGEIVSFQEKMRCKAKAFDIDRISTLLP